MPLRLPDNSLFCDGLCSYVCRPATEMDATDRLFITIKVEGFRTQAVLDTGGVYLVCDPQLTEWLDLDPTTAILQQTLRVRGKLYKGGLHRVEVVIPAEEGHSMLLQATAFVPDSDQPWPLPTYMGWHGCLERFRFAIDPAEEHFYFGPA